MSPASPGALVDRLSSANTAPAAHAKRTLSSSDEDAGEHVRRVKRSTMNQNTHQQQRQRQTSSKPNHTSSNSDDGNSASDDSATEPPKSGGNFSAHRNPMFDDDDDEDDDDAVEDDDDDSDASDASDSAKRRRRKATDKVDKVKSDKNKNLSLRKLFVINKSEGGKGGAKGKGQVVIVDHSEDVSSVHYLQQQQLLHQQQQQQMQAVAVLSASKENLNTLMPSPSAAAMATISTPTKALGATGVSPKVEKHPLQASPVTAFNQKLSNNNRTSPISSSNKVNSTPTIVGEQGAPAFTRIVLPPTPPRHLISGPIMCRLSLTGLNHIPAKRTSPKVPRRRDSMFHAKTKRSSNDLAKSPNPDSATSSSSRRNHIPPPNATAEGSPSFTSRTSTHQSNPSDRVLTPMLSPSVLAAAASSANDRLIANTVIHNSLSALRSSPNDRPLPTAASSSSNHLKQIKQEGLKSEFSRNSFHLNSEYPTPEGMVAGSSPSVARRTPQQTPGAMKQFDVSLDAGSLMPSSNKVPSAGMKREMLGIKAEFLTVSPAAGNGEELQHNAKTISGPGMCQGADEYEPAERRKRSSSVNSSPYKDKKRKKVSLKYNFD